jgi:CubicO group peptidase (beta-lactamase class C family)
MKNTLGLLASLFLLGLAAPVPADEEEAERPVPQSLDELRAAITEVMEEYDVPAVGIAMVDATGPVLVDAWGKANVEEDIDADANSMFRIGSTSKMFVALSVLKLVEEGRLSLDDRLADLAPEIEFQNPWEETNPVLLAHLLEHTTGWDDIHLPEYAHSDPTPATLREGLDFHPHSRISRWVPGSRSSYCNSGPPVAAYIVQKITGQDFEEYVRESFWEPMGMETMTYRLSDDFRSKGVTLYQGGEPQEYWHISMRPSGSINASPVDMAKFASFFVNRGNVNGVQLISEASLQRMELPATTSAAAVGQEAGYGLHNYSSRHKNWVYREHNGGVNGGLTEFSYLPEAKVGHAVMINSGAGAAYMEISDLVRDYETRNLVAPEAPVAAAIGAEHKAIEGLYFPINPRQEIARFIEQPLGVFKLWFEENELKLKPLLGGEARSYAAAGDNLYLDMETGAVTVSSVEDPLDGPVVHAGTQVIKPVSPFLAYGQLAIAALWGLSIAISIPYALVWGVRRLRGKIPSGPAIRIRVLPLLAGLSVIAFLTLFSVGMRDPFATLGQPTFISIGIMLMTVAFALFAALGLITAIRERGTKMNRVNYWYATTSSVLHCIVVAYLASFGIVGLMTWA